MKHDDKDPVDGLLILAGFLSLVMFLYMWYLIVSGEMVKF